MIVVLPRAAACQLHPKATFLSLWTIDVLKFPLEVAISMVQWTGALPRTRAMLLFGLSGHRTALGPSWSQAISKAQVASCKFNLNASSLALPPFARDKFSKWYRCKHKVQGSWNFYNWNFFVLSIDAIQATTSDCVRPILASCWQQLCALCSAEHMSPSDGSERIGKDKSNKRKSSTAFAGHLLWFDYY